MEQLELLQRWEQYCETFIAKCPDDYSLENSVFDASGLDIPEALMTKARNEDMLQSITFGKKTIELLGTLECTDERMQELTAFLKKGDVQLACGFVAGKSEPFHVLTDDSSLSGHEVWFIGDIHGDLLALRSTLAFINSNAKQPPIYVFMGDLFDRNPLGLNVLLDVIELIKSCPGQVLWLVGNHDDGLSCDEKGVFRSTITPKQFTDYLNEIDNPIVTEFARAVIDLVKQLPTGLVLPNGLLATHGGVPSRKERAVKDIWANIKDADIPKYLADARKELLMNRFVADTPAGTKMGTEFSWLELVNLSLAIERRYGIRIRAYLRGHDHCDLCRHEWASINPELKLTPEQQNNSVNNVLTMTTMVQMDEAEYTLPGFLHHKTSYPSVARMVPGRSVPQCYSLAFDDKKVGEYYALADKAHCRQTANWLGDKLGRLQRQEEEAKKADDEAYEKASQCHVAHEEAKTRRQKATVVLEKAKTAVNDMKEMEHKCKETVDHSQKELVQKDGAILDKNDEIGASKGNLAKVTRELESYMQQWPNDKKSLEEKLGRFEEIKRMMDGYNERIAALGDRIKERRDAREEMRLRDELRQLNSDKKKLEHDNPALQDEIKRLKHDLEQFSEASVQKHIDEGKAIISRLNDTINTVEVDLKRLEREKQELLKELEAAQLALSAAKQKVQAAEKELEQAQVVYEQLVKAEKKAMEDYANSYGMSEQRQQEHERIRQLVAECKQKRDEYQARA